MKIQSSFFRQKKYFTIMRARERLLRKEMHTNGTEQPIENWEINQFKISSLCCVELSHLETLRQFKSWNPLLDVLNLQSLAFKFFELYLPCSALQPFWAVLGEGAVIPPVPQVAAVDHTHPPLTSRSEIEAIQVIQCIKLSSPP